MDGSDDPTSGMRHAKFHSKEHVLGLVDGLVDSGHILADITGGEPTLHPNIVDIVRHATDRGLATRLITLGQWLPRRMHGLKDTLLRELLAAGLTDFRLSVHECEEPQFKELTGGSWAKQKANMDELDARGFQYMTNTTITKANYKRLPIIAREISSHNVYNATILFMMAHYKWGASERTENVQARYSEAAKYCREFVDILEDKKIAAIVRYAPLCTIAGLEKNHVGAVGVRYDPHEWMNAMDHMAKPETITPERTKAMSSRIQLKHGEPSDGLYLVQGAGKVGGYDIIAGRGNPQSISKVFPKACQGCSAMPVCDGLEPQYLEHHGSSELIPYINDNRGNVLDKDRLAYLPAYFVKLKPHADMKSVIGKAFEPKPLKDNPKVSIIVTCYNYGKYLQECLESVYDQTYESLEVIVVDDGSTDDTAEIVENFSHPIGNVALGLPIKFPKYIYQENSGQPAYPRNAGIKASTGELILCLDADDILKPTMIEECVQALKKNPTASIAYTGVTCFGESDQEWMASSFDYGTLLMQNNICYASVYRREVWEATGGYSTNLRGMEDYEQWVKAAGLGFQAVAIPRQLWFYRVHADGIFLSDVQPNFEAKFRQIVLNNPHLYPPNMVAEAKAGKTVTRAVG